MDRGITVLSLFDGMSCGRIALERAGIKVRQYFASEIDKHAIKVTQHNYPNTIQIGDVTQVKGENLPKIDLLMGGSPCFPKGQRIITINGFKNIEDIKKGDMVLTHKGRYREVVTPMERLYDGKLYKIRPTYYNFTIDTTNEHPFFTQRGWVNAEELKEEDYLSMPLNKEMINPQQITYKQVINQHKEIYKTTNLPILNENFWKLIGYWLAEGWTRDKRNGKDSRNTYRIFLSVTERKMKFIQPVVESLGIHYRIEKSRTCDKINFGSKEYWLYIKQFTNGNRSTNKLIPEFVQNMPKHLISAFVEGYKNGDGSENNEKIKYSSTSKILLEGLQRLLLKTENKLYSLTQSHYDRESVIEGRVVNAKDSYSLEKNKTDNKFAYFTEDYVFYKVRSITTEDVNNLTVYNFEVAEDNSYCLPITAVHNCQGFSFAGKQLNFEDERSKLFFEFVRLLKETNPKYFLLENVKMKKEYQDVITEHLGVEPIEINSNLLSAQNRKRIYWTNIPEVTIPNDKGILLKDIVHENNDEVLNIELPNFNVNPSGNGMNGDVYSIEKSKSRTLTTNKGEGQKISVAIAEYVVPFDKTLQILDKEVQRGKVGYFRKNSQANRVYYIHDKAITLTGEAGGGAAKMGQYLFGCITPDRIEKRQNGQRFNDGKKFYTLTAQDKHGVLIEGYIRKLTPIECERLQTVPDNYTDCVSNSQRYKMLGNGWTVSVVSHIFSYLPKEYFEINV